MMIEESHVIIQAKIETRSLDPDGEARIPSYKLQLSDMHTGAHLLLEASKEAFDELEVEQPLVVFTQRMWFPHTVWSDEEAGIDPGPPVYQKYVEDVPQIEGLEVIG